MLTATILEADGTCAIESSVLSGVTSARAKPSDAAAAVI